MLHEMPQTRLSLRLVAVAAVLLTGGGSAATIALHAVPMALAQDQSAAVPTSGHHNRMGPALMSLNLSDAQKSQIRSIMADAKKQNANVTDRETRYANYKAARAKIEGSVLTPAQRTQFEAKMSASQDQAPHS